MEVAVGLDESNLGSESLRIHERLEIHVVELELAAHTDHVPVEAFFDERAISPDAELAAEHDVEGVRWRAARFVAELDVANLLAPPRAFLVATLDPIAHDLREVERAQANVSVLVARHADERVLRQELGESLGEHDRTVVLIAPLSLEHEVDDPIDQRSHRQLLLDGANTRDHVELLFLDGELAPNVLGRHDHAGFSGDRDPIRKPPCFSAHRFDDEVAARGDAVGPKVQKLFGHHVDRREEAEGEIDPAIVVVDRFGQVHDAHALVLRHLVLLVLVKEVGRLERVIAADRDERIDAQIAKGMMDTRKPFGLFGIEEVRRCLDPGARIDPRGSDDDAAAVSNAANVGGSEHPVVLGFDDRVVDQVVLLQVGVPVKDAEDLDTGLEKRRGDRGDYRIGGRSGAPGKDDGNSLNRFHVAHSRDCVAGLPYPVRGALLALGAMAIDPTSVGYETPPIEFEYDWKDVVMYALGVGATPAHELDFLYEGRGPKVLPTFCTIPTFAAFDALVDRIGCDRAGMVHHSQEASVFKPLPPRATLKVLGRVDGIYDLKRMAMSVFTIDGFDQEGDLAVRGEVTLLLLKDGRFGGDRPPRATRIAVPERAPDFVSRETIPEQQALLYRLNGDYNPLHADPAFAAGVGFEKPILHGLCTFGYAGRAVVRHACGGEPTRLRSLRGQFSSPVFPGDTLIVRGWNELGQTLLAVSTEERPNELCLSQARAVIS